MYEDRAETIRIIHEQQIPKIMLAGATGLDNRRIADFVKHRVLPETSVACIKETVRKVAKIWEAFGCRVLVDSPEKLKEMHETALNSEQIVNVLDRAKHEQALAVRKAELDAMTESFSMSFTK